MRIHKVLDVGEFETENGTTYLMECFGEEGQGCELTQFTIHTDFPQFYRIMQHMKKPTIEPYEVEMESDDG